MKKTIIPIFLFGLIFLCFLRPSTAGEIITQEIMEEQILTSIDFVKTADNFIILFDSSSSMNKKIPDTQTTYVAAAKQILRERNANFPDLEYNAGLYLYTPFKEIYRIQPYDRDKFAQAIEQLPDSGSGATIIQRSMHNLREIVSGLDGKTVVFMFTDGNTTLPAGGRGPTESVEDTPEYIIGKKPVEIAREIAAEHDISFIIISTATGTEEKRINEAVASINASSRVIPFETLYNRPEYMPGILFDVEATSVAKIEHRQEIVGFTMDDILFEASSAEIPMDQLKDLEDLAGFLNQNPSAVVVVDGYSDNVGSDESCLQISRKRAFAVSDYLVQQQGVDEDRVICQWYGELNPAADNSTAEGRKLNRRVEIFVGGI